MIITKVIKIITKTIMVMRIIIFNYHNNNNDNYRFSGPISLFCHAIFFLLQSVLSSIYNFHLHGDIVIQIRLVFQIKYIHENEFQQIPILGSCLHSNYVLL